MFTVIKLEARRVDEYYDRNKLEVTQSWRTTNARCSDQKQPC